MSWRHYLFLFILGLLFPLGVSRFQTQPGYMDADYYFAGGIQIAEGRGFTEPYLWNYLDDPSGLPHPSHTYWMPLASIVSAIGMWLAGQITYAAGRAPFIFLSAFVPLVTAALACRLSRRSRLALVSGLLSIFSLYYAPFMPVPDNYALYMLLGGLFLLLAPRREKWIPVALGMLAGLLTLARSDGLLWLALAGLAILWKAKATPGRPGAFFIDWRRLVLPAVLLALAGYSLVMGGWHIRNLRLFGSIMTPGGGRLLWLQSYNQTFVYPPDQLNRAAFFEAGWQAAVEDRLAALSSNLGNTFAAQGEIFLFPFILVGVRQVRRRLETRIALTGWSLLFVVMTLIFPFAGSRGSFFHAGAAFQPYWWAVAPIGLESAVAWARGRGRLTDANAPLFFQGTLVLLAISMTLYLVHLRVTAGGWAREDAIYPAVEAKLLENGIRHGQVVIVRNPPGYYLASGRPSISLPFGDESTILTVAEKFDARFLVLEAGGTFDSIDDLYRQPEANPSFTYLGEVDGARLYRIEPGR